MINKDYLARLGLLYCLFISCTSIEHTSKMKDNPEDKFDYKRLEELLLSGQRELESLKGKDLVLVIGKTVSGKSTFISSLQGHRFEKFEDPETGSDYLLRTTRDDPVYTSPKIGSGMNSCTLLPGVFQLIGDKNLYLCDTAGFGDSRGKVEDVFTYLAVQMAIQAAGEIKALFGVIESTLLTAGRGEGLKQITSIISSIFSGSAFYSSFYLLVNNKEVNGRNKKQLLKLMEKTRDECFESSENLENLSEAQNIRDRGAVLSILTSTGNVIPFTPWSNNQEEIVDIIRNTQSIPTNELGSAINNKYAEELKRVLLAIDSDGIKWIKDIQEATEFIINKANALKKKFLEIDNNKSDMERLQVYLVSEEALKGYDPVYEKEKKRKEFENEKAQIEFEIQALVSNIASLKGDLSKEENCTQRALLSTELYDEQTLYGTVSKGIVNYHTFSVNTIDKPIVLYEEVYCGKYSTEGSGPSFYNKSVNQYTASIRFATPSHAYGAANVYTYTEARYTDEAKMRINELKIKVDKQSSLLETKRKEESSVIDRFTAAEIALVKEMHSSKQEIESNIARCKRTIGNCELDVKEVKEEIGKNATIIHNSSSKMEENKNRFKMLFTIYEIMKMKIKPIDDFMELYKGYSKIFEEANQAIHLAYEI